MLNQKEMEQSPLFQDITYEQYRRMMDCFQAVQKSYQMCIRDRIKTYAPDATYLMWLDCRGLGLTNEQLHDFMIQKAGLGLNDGCSFGRSLNGYMGFLSLHSRLL